MRCKKFLICCALGAFMICQQNVMIAHAAQSCETTINKDVEAFYLEKKNSIDVLAIGDSNLYRGISPQILWKKQGITSYILASASQSPWLTYKLFQEALRYQNPKVIILDPYELFRSKNSSSSRYCGVINSMQSFDLKTEAIRSDEASFTKEEIESLYSNSLYKLVYKAFESVKPKVNIKNPVKVTYSKRKGYYLNITSRPYVGVSNYMEVNKGLHMQEKNIKYYDKIIEEAKKHNIEVLLLKIPTSTDWSEKQSKDSEEYARLRGIRYFDMNKLTNENSINWSTDTKDQGGHLNYFGSVKITTELGTYLDTNYLIKRVTDPKVIASFNRNYDDFDKDLNHMLINHIIGDAK